MKRVMISIFVAAILLSSFVSAGWWSDLTGRISYNPRCFDSDNGINYEQRGQATDGRGGNGIDYCLDGKIREYYCDMDALEVKFNDVDCPGDEACKNGACVMGAVTYTTSSLKDSEVLVLVLDKPQEFGYDKIVVNKIASGEAEFTYTKTMKVKTGDMINLDGNKFEVAVGENVEMSRRGTYVEVVEKPVEKIVYVDKIVEVEKPGVVKSIWRKIFGGTKD